jgi:two-component system cell cycle response regulator DivK
MNTAGALAGLDVLVVDDDERSRKLLRVILTHHGASVRVATTGGEAMAMLEQAAPQVALLDIHLPDTTGTALLAWMRTRPALAAVPAIAVTASVMPADHHRMQAAGFAACEPKPVQAASLIATVQAALATGGGAAGGAAGGRGDRA